MSVTTGANSEANSFRILLGTDINKELHWDIKIMIEVSKCGV